MPQPPPAPHEDRHDMFRRVSHSTTCTSQSPQSNPTTQEALMNAKFPPTALNPRAPFVNPIPYERLGFCWGAVLAGLTAAIGLDVLFAELGLALNLGIIDRNSSGGEIAAANGIAWVVTGLVALFVGAWVAGRMASTRTRVEGALHSCSSSTSSSWVSFARWRSRARCTAGAHPPPARPMALTSDVELDSARTKPTIHASTERHRRSRREVDAEWTRSPEPFGDRQARTSARFRSAAARGPSLHGIV
mgnify:CR=1 FL=1